MSGISATEITQEQEQLIKNSSQYLPELKELQEQFLKESQDVVVVPPAGPADLLPFKNELIELAQETRLRNLSTTFKDALKTSDLKTVTAVLENPDFDYTLAFKKGFLLKHTVESLSLEYPHKGILRLLMQKMDLDYSDWKKYLYSDAHTASPWDAGILLVQDIEKALLKEAFLYCLESEDLEVSSSSGLNSVQDFDKNFPKEVVLQTDLELNNKEKSEKIETNVQELFPQLLVLAKRKRLQKLSREFDRAIREDNINDLNAVLKNPSFDYPEALRQRFLIDNDSVVNLVLEFGSKPLLLALVAHRKENVDNATAIQSAFELKLNNLWTAESRYNVANDIASIHKLLNIGIEPSIKLWDLLKGLKNKVINQWGSFINLGPNTIHTIEPMLEHIAKHYMGNDKGDNPLFCFLQDLLQNAKKDTDSDTITMLLNLFSKHGIINPKNKDSLDRILKENKFRCNVDDLPLLEYREVTRADHNPLILFNKVYNVHQELLDRVNKPKQAPIKYK